MRTAKPKPVVVDTTAAPPGSRALLEDGAYLMVDFLYPEPPQADRWPRLTVGRTLVVDLTPAGAPILLELRQVADAWQESAALRPPEAPLAGTARILATGRRAAAVSVRTTPDRSTVHIRLAAPEAGVAIRVAPQVLVELAGLVREDAATLRGHLVGLWILEVPRLSVAAILLRALGVSGPPIGIGTPGGDPGPQTAAPARPRAAEPERPH